MGSRFGVHGFINLNSQMATGKTKGSVVAERLTVKLIQEKVAKYYSLCVSDILSNSRQRKIAWARQTAMWLTREFFPTKSLNSIGQSFRRDHSTIHYGIRMVDDRKSYEPFRSDIEFLVGSINKIVR